MTLNKLLLMDHNVAETTPLLEQHRVEYKCWACWESTNRSSNPLIRVCYGCKDPELQYIHQQCINSYISSLPLPRRPRSPRPGTQTSIRQFLDQEEGIRPVLYDCTRCRDPYVVQQKLISPLEVIWKDIYLRLIFILLIIACAIMTVTCFVIAGNTWETDFALFYIFGFPITIIMLAFGLTVAGLLCGIWLGVTIWNASSGKTRLHVVGERLL
jgi:hypothetical protein